MMNDRKKLRKVAIVVAWILVIMMVITTLFTFSSLAAEPGVQIMENAVEQCLLL